VLFAADRKFTGRFLDDVDNKHNLVWLRTGRRRDIDCLEELQGFETAFGALDQDLVEGIAFADIEFAANDEITGLFIAADFNALDIGARALIDRIGDGNRVILEVAVATWLNLGEGVALTGNLFGNLDDRVFDFLGVVGVAFPRLDKAVQLRGIDALNRAFDLNAAELVLLAFFDGDSDRRNDSSSARRRSSL